MASDHLYTQLAGKWGSGVKVYHARLDLPEDILAPLADTLSPDEQARAARLRSMTLKRHYRAGRGILRLILGAHLNCAPQAVRFAYGTCGKPKLEQPMLPAEPPNTLTSESGQDTPTDQTPGLQPRALAGDIRFNVSHSAGQMLCALTTARDVGIDLEQLRPLPDLESIARRYFSPLERQALLALPPAERTMGFFKCWTRKEAYIKARGEGFTIPFDSFSVSIGDAPALVAQPAADTTRWGMYALTPAQGFTAALVVEERE